MPEHYGKIIKDAGFNLLSIANNHVGDFDDKGRKKTVQILDSLKIHYAGQTNYPFVLFEKDNVKFSFCAFAPNENTLSINNIDSAKILVRYLKTISDIVIVSFHGGAEGSKHEHVPKKREIFFNENRGDVYAFSHAVIDVGADLVLGHGPHVTRAAEVYKNKFIIYSLGNFCTYGMFNLKGPNGIAPLLKIRLKTNGDFIHADVVSTKQDKINGLQLDENHTAFNKLKFLTDSDFINHNLLFSENRISVKKNKVAYENP
jgi:poly-gamma-glutamate capsule biosynthesis protein CapA/YwtB (metallophosphatase superfamily)